ncbi:MAG: PaaI family thioesterase [Nocardioides sp.]
MFDKRHVGAPGIAHGGAVATVVDDLFGFLLYVVGELAVTRNLNVEYLAPVRLGVPYQCQAELAQRERRKLFMNARVKDQGGLVVVTARALFLTVDVAHFGDEGAATFDMLRRR